MTWPDGDVKEGRDIVPFGYDGMLDLESRWSADDVLYQTHVLGDGRTCMHQGRPGGDVA